MKPPPRDPNGKTQPHDHDEILNDDFVIRRISEQQIATDSATGQRKVSSLAFKASSGENESMSVDIEKLIVAAGLKPEEYVTTPRWVGSIRIQVAPIRTTNCSVGFDPLPENSPHPENPYHGGVWGNFNKATQRAIRQASNWLVEIEGVNLQE
ncbi:MAG: hypothetical protein IT559_04640 [Alphaproteobacteria bacterium]|nr:hypothetical protein [Alphaproteobacteria bacterium]